MPSFATLWNNHPHVKGEGALLDKRVYENQCAINLSAALIRSGINMTSYNGTWSWQKDKPKYAIRAQELANWLATGGSRLATKVEKLQGAEVFGEVAGKKGIPDRSGIVFFQNYWGAGQPGRPYRSVERLAADGYAVVGAHPHALSRYRSRLRLPQGAIHMVLATAMKRTLYMATGGLLFAVLGFLLGAWATNLYSTYAAKSDDDINLSVGAFLLFWPLIVAVGVYLGNRVYQRRAILPRHK